MSDDPFEIAKATLILIADEQKTYTGYGNYDIGPRYTAEEAQELAQRALTAIEDQNKPWLRCPSTHCERSQECRSPSECSASIYRTWYDPPTKSPPLDIQDGGLINGCASEVATS